MNSLEKLWEVRFSNNWIKLAIDDLSNDLAICLYNAAWQAAKDDLEFKAMVKEIDKRLALWYGLDKSLLDKSLSEILREILSRDDVTIVEWNDAD